MQSGKFLLCFTKIIFKMPLIHQTLLLIYRSRLFETSNTLFLFKYPCNPSIRPMDLPEIARNTCNVAPLVQWHKLGPVCWITPITRHTSMDCLKQQRELGGLMIDTRRLVISPCLPVKSKFSSTMSKKKWSQYKITVCSHKKSHRFPYVPLPNPHLHPCLR